MRGSRKLGQRGSNFDNVFLVDKGREDPNATISGPSSARQRNDGTTLNTGLFHSHSDFLTYTMYTTGKQSDLEAQWLSDRVLDSRPRGRGFEPHRRHCVVSLSKNIIPTLVLVQPRTTRPSITERL